jgi:hypothetical protein
MGVDPFSATLLGVGAIGGGAASYFGAREQAGAARDAAAAQLQAARESIAAQERGADKGFDIFSKEAANARKFLSQQTSLARQDIAPFRDIGLANLQGLSSFANDPNSPQAQAERDAFQKVLARNLSARGLTASGTEIAGLGDFELGLGRERRGIQQGLAGIGTNAAQNLASLRQGLGQGLAGISSQLGQSGMSLYGGLGQGIGNALQQGAAGFGNSTLAAGQASAQGLIGIGNAFQGGLAGLAGLRNSQMQQQQFNSLLSVLGGGGGIPSGNGLGSGISLSPGWQSYFGG